MAEKSAYHDLFHSTSRYIILRNIFFVVSIAFSILVVRTLGPKEYGKWSLMWQIISTLAPILSLGFLGSLSKFLPEYPEREAKVDLFSRAFFIVLAGFAAAFLIYLGVTALFPRLLV